MKLSLNINEKASVTLTEYGEKLLINASGGVYYNTWNYDTLTCIFTAPIWTIMLVFGDKMYVGNQQIFKDNLVTVESGLL